MTTIDRTLLCLRKASIDTWDSAYLFLNDWMGCEDVPSCRQIVRDALCCSSLMIIMNTRCCHWWKLSGLNPRSQASRSQSFEPESIYLILVTCSSDGDSLFYCISRALQLHNMTIWQSTAHVAPLSLKSLSLRNLSLRILPHTAQRPNPSRIDPTL